MDKLTAINAMLASISVAPVTSADAGTMDVITARAVLDRINTEVQELGWWFNTDFNAQLIPATDKRIRVPKNTLRVTGLYTRGNYAQRDGILYDPVRHTYEFEQPLDAEIVYLLDYNDCPSAAQLYIMKRAIVEYFRNEDAEGNKLQDLNRDMLQAYARLQSEGTNQLGINMGMNARIAGNTARMYQLRGVQPYSLNRNSRWAHRWNRWA